MIELAQRVEQNIIERHLLRRGQAVLVAVSGGLDSMVLLHLLAKLSAKHGWRLTVAHFNHQLRGRNSGLDEKLVVRTARRLGLPCVTDRADVRKHAGVQKLSLEMAARELRHAFLARAADKFAIRTIALAHHADDQVELFFLRLLRGAGGAGLSGMKPRNPSPADAGKMLIRPLLDQTKEELQEFAKAEKIPLREDATNAQLDMQRNRIRHELLPLLVRHYQPALKQVILRQMNLTGAEADFAGTAAKEWLEMLALTPALSPGERENQSRRQRTPTTDRPPHARGIIERLPLIPAFSPSGGEGAQRADEGVACKLEPFASLPLAVQRQCLQMQLAAAGVAASFDLIEGLRLCPDMPITVAKNLSVSRAVSGRIQLSHNEKPLFNPSQIELEFKARKGRLTFEGVAIRWEMKTAFHGTFRAPQGGVSHREFFDATKVGSGVVLRHWRPGDRFQPIGMKSAVKLQDLFTNQKVSRAQRHRAVVGVTGGGEVFWVEGLRLGGRFKLDKTTRRVLQWQWKRL